MTDAERQPDGRQPEADSDRTRPDRTEEVGVQGRRADPPVEVGEGDGEGPSTASFRSDGGPGSVLRERQPGYGGMDARRAADGEPSWQAVTSDRYGHRVEERSDAADAPLESEDEADAPGEPSSR